MLRWYRDWKKGEPQDKDLLSIVCEDIHIDLFEIVLTNPVNNVSLYFMMLYHHQSVNEVGVIFDPNYLLI